MFIKAYLSKFEWAEKELPDNLTGAMVDNLILTSNTENFVVVADETTPFFTNTFSILERSERYGLPEKIQVRYYNGVTKMYDYPDFVLFKLWKNDETPAFAFINFYSRIIMEINSVLRQHIKATVLTAHITANTLAEKTELEKVFAGFDGVKITVIKGNQASERLDIADKKLDITQFEIKAQFAELEQVKHEIEKDLFLRLGIEQPDNKTHVTVEDVSNSEIIVDLINTYELKLRKDFCKRYNERFNRNLTVKLHGSIEPSTNPQNEEKPLEDTKETVKQGNIDNE